MTRDTDLAFRVCSIILDDRDPQRDMAEILVTAEHTIAALLLLVMGENPAKAAAMLNEGLVPGVENRLCLFASRQQECR